MTTRRTDQLHGRAVAIAAIQANLADALLVRTLDRAARSVVDGAQLLDQAKRQGWQVLGIDGTDTRDPKQSLTNNVRMCIAQEVRDKISERTREGLARARREGKALGCPSKITPTLSRRIVRLRQDGLSAQKIAATLTAKKVPTPSGGATWHHSTVRAVLAREGVA